MTKSEIISKVVNDGQFLKICKKITGSDPLTEDLFQEVILILLEKDEQLIVDTYNRNELKYLFVRIVINNFKSNNSPFAVKYRKIFSNSVSIEDSFIDTIAPEVCEPLFNYELIKEDLKKPATSKEEWFEKETMKLVIKHKFISQVSKKTGINKYFLTKAVNNYTQRIKNDKKFNARAV